MCWLGTHDKENLDKRLRSARGPSTNFLPVGNILESRKPRFNPGMRGNGTRFVVGHFLSLAQEILQWALFFWRIGSARLLFKNIGVVDAKFPVLVTSQCWSTMIQNRRNYQRLGNWRDVASDATRWAHLMPQFIFFFCHT